jgi:ribosomal protein S18 acetylase RimI-like enzyme
MINVRDAAPGDAWTMGAILALFQHQTGWMPVMYTQEEAAGYCKAMIEHGWVRVAEMHGIVRGFIARDEYEVCALYVAQNARGKGVGKALISDAMARCPHLWLRVHEVNHVARAFYGRAGFREYPSESGQFNDEGLPELTCRWTKELA